MILIISSMIDRTSDYIVSKYGAENFFRFNVDDFSSYSIDIDELGFNIEKFKKLISSGNCESIYFRKPRHEVLDDVFDTSYHDFVHRETYSIIEGIAESFEGPVLTKPSIMRRANNKTLQAMISKKVGFLLPDMKITNSLNSIKCFSSRYKSIVKPVALGEVMHVGNVKEFVQTNMFDLSVPTENVNYSPVYLQKYQDKDYEVRATFVAKKSYAVRIDSDNHVDWRKKGANNRYSILSLPKNIYQKCLEFMSLLGMEFGCFDFIVKGGEYYFLEMNANGQWGWLEFSLDLEISKSIFNFLKVKNGDPA